MGWKWHQIGVGVVLVGQLELGVVVLQERRARLFLDILLVESQGQIPKVEKGWREIPTSIADSAYCYGILDDACIVQQILVLDVLKQGVPRCSRSWMEIVHLVRRKR